MVAQPLPGNFGVESTIVPIISLVGAGVLVMLSVNQPTAMVLELLLAALLIAQAMFSLNMSRRGKFLIWERLANGLALEGDEMVLDVGCGLGLSTISIAKVLPEGELFGLDRFVAREADVDARAVAEQNAIENGVGSRIEFLVGSPEELPFDDGSFDLVMTNGMLRTHRSKDDRARLLGEMWRTVVPGGRLLLVDTQHGNEYRGVLATLGAIDVEMWSLGPDGWSGSPFYASRAITARRPLEAEDTSS